MARSRNLKPGFFANDELAEIEPLGRLLFAGLWTIADRDGRLTDRPKRIKAEVLPYDACDVDDLLGQLAMRGFILRYQAEDGAEIIQIMAWSRHQNPHQNEQASILAPYNSGTSTVHASEPNRTSTEIAPEQHSSNREDSLYIDSLNRATGRDARGRHACAREGNAAHAATPTCTQIFEHYKSRIQPSARLDAHKQIELRLATFSPGDLKHAIDKFAADAWWMEHNGSRGAPWFFKSDARIEQFLNITRPPPKKNGQTAVICTPDNLEELRRKYGIPVNGVPQ